MTIGSNLKSLRKRKKLSQEEVAKALNLFRSTYSGYEHGVAQPNLENLLNLSDFYQVSTDFLLRENFEKFTESDWKRIEYGNSADVKGQNLRVLASVIDQNNEDVIEMIPLKASAGYVSGYADPEYLKVLPTFSLPFLSKQKKYRSFPIQGDSMPPVVEGSFVVGEFVQNWQSIRSGTPCIVVTKEDGIVFKVLNNMLEESGSFQLCSTNTLYKPYMVHVNSIVEIWRFVNYISPELPDVQMDTNSISQSLQEIRKDIQYIQQKIKF
jgi:transcriptional regulator with XRE-family HTH domain